MLWGTQRHLVTRQRRSVQQSRLQHGVCALHAALHKQHTRVTVISSVAVTGTQDNANKVVAGTRKHWQTLLEHTAGKNGSVTVRHLVSKHTSSSGIGCKSSVGCIMVSVSSVGRPCQVKLIYVSSATFTTLLVLLAVIPSLQHACTCCAAEVTCMKAIS